MPVSYKFIRISDGEPMTISEMDDLICEYFEQNPAPIGGKCSMYYDIITMSGVAASFQEGKTNEKNVEDVIAKHKACDNPTEERVLEAFRKFLYREYYMESWRDSF